MTPYRTELDRFAIVLMLVLCSIWGGQQVVVKLGNAGISPLWQSGLRSLGATALVWLWAQARGVRLWQSDATLWPGLVAGALFAAEFALIFKALEFTSASRGVIFLYTAPFFVALGAVWLLPQESMRRAQWIGMALAFAGILVLFGENLLRPSGTAWIGDLMMLFAAAFWAATTLVVKATPLSRASPEKTLLYQLGVSAAILPALSILFGEPGVYAPTPLVWASLAFQIVVIASSSYLTWFWLVRHYPATRLSSFSFLTPVMGVLAGVVLLGEPLTAAVLIALATVGCGIWIANRPAPRSVSGPGAAPDAGGQEAGSKVH
ncbi:MAG: DMT family transporter [Rhodocyclaceae bacterium]|nr:DMT family transporter [Rhodocyclaceae bacterium]